MQRQVGAGGHMIPRHLLPYFHGLQHPRSGAQCLDPRPLEAPLRLQTGPGSYSHSTCNSIPTSSVDNPHAQAPPPEQATSLGPRLSSSRPAPRAPRHSPTPRPSCLRPAHHVVRDPPPSNFTLRLPWTPRVPLTLTPRPMSFSSFVTPLPIPIPDSHAEAPPLMVTPRPLVHAPPLGFLSLHSKLPRRSPTPRP